MPTAIADPLDQAIHRCVCGGHLNALGEHTDTCRECAEHPGDCPEAEEHLFCTKPVATVCRHGLCLNPAGALTQCPAGLDQCCDLHHEDLQ